MTHLLKNRNGMTVGILPLGGIIQRLTAPDREGRYADVVLGFDSEDTYSGEHPCFGALIGRYGNRIANGRFSIDGNDYQLACNNGRHHLHGGHHGFDKVVWAVEEGDHSLALSHVSDDGDQGYPGELSVLVRYTLDDDDALRIDYSASTTRPTPVNLTSHPYFNLAGHGEGAVLDHLVQINASRFTPVDEYLIPTGEIAEVSNTPFDFRRPVAIGDRFDANNEQLCFGGGYDHNFVLDATDGALRMVARAIEPQSGRVLEVLTTEPGLQFYTGNSLNGIQGKEGAVYNANSGFCLETQHFPDAPNHAGFPTTILRPGDHFTSTTVYRFTTIDANS